MANKLSKHFKRVIKIYSRGSMVVHTFLMYMYFDKKIDNMMHSVIINTYTAKDHVKNIEQKIHTVKESTICILRNTPFKYLHKLIINNIVYFALLCLNAVPVSNVISENISVRDHREN